MQQDDAGSAPMLGSQDITRRLRRWTHAVDSAPASDIMEQAADEIENLRMAIRRLAEQDATLSVCDGNVTVDLDGTLTDDELWAVGCAMISYAANKDDEECVKIRFILRDLMRRLI